MPCETRAALVSRTILARLALWITLEYTGRMITYEVIKQLNSFLLTYFVYFAAFVAIILYVISWFKLFIARI